MVDIARNHGALLLGGLVATGLSGVVVVQAIIYFKLYPLDSPILKALVLIIWSLDLTHSGLVCAAIWNYLIKDFGFANNINVIPLSLSLTIVFTAILTFLVHCFFAHRIFLLSKRNWYLTMPILLLATFRLCSACATSGEMIQLRMFSLFKAQFQWLFSLGLALSSIVDIQITISLFILLQNSRSRSLSLNHILDSLILYTFEIGSLTCAATIVSMICWLTMGNNRIFMGLHFVIGKLYANSLLASLNTRHDLRRQRHSSRDVVIPALESPRHPDLFFHNPYLDSEIQLQQVQISVEKSITCETSGSLHASRS